MIEVTDEELEQAMREYGYSMNFRDSRTKKQRTVRDLNAMGYLMLARKKGVESINSECLEYHRELVEGDWHIWAVVKCVVTFEGKHYSKLADVDDRSQSVRGPDMVVRSADTIAFKRAAAIAMGIDKERLQNFATKDDIAEEEPYTPVPHSEEESPKQREPVEKWDDLI